MNPESGSYNPHKDDDEPLEADSLRSSAEYEVPGQDLQRSLSPEAIRAVQDVSGPIVEVGGKAVELLGGSDILPSKPITSDLKDWHSKKGTLDVIADGKNLPFTDSSVGMFMANHIAPTDYFSPTVRDYIDDGPGGSDKFFERQGLAAELAEKDYEIFRADPNATITYNLRINFMKEMTRSVQLGGLMLFGAITDKDIEVAQALGWETVQIMARSEGVFNCLFKKKAEN